MQMSDIFLIVRKKKKNKNNNNNRVTSLEQLSLAEFSGEEARPKVYENDHKNALVIWLDLVLNIKIWAHC
jgi:hypothetical protein